jgi:DNA-binding PadR family transcriptional regulator
MAIYRDSTPIERQIVVRRAQGEVVFNHHHNEPGHGRRERRHEPEDEMGADREHRHGRGPGAHRGGWQWRAFGPGAGLGMAGSFGRGPVARRGDVRTAILALLTESPMHGYQVMQELRDRSGGAWAPSAGSIYPTLQQLEDEGLVRAEERDGRRVFTLTESGRVQATAAKPGAPWAVDRGREGADLRGLIAQVAQASVQVFQVGSPAAIAEAERILTATRRSLYQLLAGDDQQGSGEPAQTEPTATTEPSEPTDEPS